MSTKIYDAYKYSGTPEELMNWLFDFRDEYEDVAVKELCPLFVSTSKYLKLIPEPTEPDILFKDPLDYFSTVRGIKLIIKRGFNDPLNIDAAVTVYFHSGMIVVQFFGLDFGLRKYSIELRRLINKSKRLTDFSYWDSADRPDWITDDEWNTRKEFYDELTEKNTSFNSIGLTYELSNNESILKICRRISEKIRENEVS